MYYLSQKHHLLNCKMGHFLIEIFVRLIVVQKLFLVTEQCRIFRCIWWCLRFLKLFNCFCFEKHKTSRKCSRPTKSYFSLSIFSKLGFRTILFISASIEFQALQNVVHYKTEFLFSTND
jgi:hypothetical protein